MSNNSKSEPVKIQKILEKNFKKKVELNKIKLLLKRITKSK